MKRAGRLARRTRRGSSRAGERGAAVFVVVLVITLLTGIGLFAARSSSLSTATTGHHRQMTQTHYITEYAILTAAAELSSPRKEAYVKLMTAPPDGVSPCYPTYLVSNPTCYRFGYQDIENQLKKSLGQQQQTGELVVPLSPDAKTAGSLGRSDLEADFRIEMTDLGPASPPVAGSDLTSAGAANVQYMSVTLSATGQVRPRLLASPNKDKAVAASASIERARARIIVGPLPKL